MQTFQGPENVRWSELEGDVPERSRIYIEEPYITSKKLEAVGTRAERGKRAILIRRPLAEARQRRLYNAPMLPASKRERGNQMRMRCRAEMFDCGMTVETKIKGKERDVQNWFNYGASGMVNANAIVRTSLTMGPTIFC